MLDLLYASIAAARRRSYERHPERRRRLAQPVISVGNLSVGGTGKTPLVVRICDWLIEIGERPAVLTRGYGRLNRLDGALVVSDGARILAGVDEAGDEPAMIASAVPGCRVVVAEDRYLGGVLADRRLGATVHVLDDGFQHVQLARDLDVLVTYPGEIPTGRVLPAGRLRESGDAAARAHLLVVMNADEATARSEAWTLGIGEACGAARVVAPAANSDRVVAVAGIADPAQFFEGLRAAGWNVVHTLAFRDHYHYRSADIASIRDAQVTHDATRVVTTAKDAVRLTTRSLPFELAVPPLSLVVDRWETLANSIAAAILRAREARTA